MFLRMPSGFCLCLSFLADRLRCVWVWVSLDFDCLGFVRLLKSVGLCLLPKLGHFQPVFPQIGLHHFTLSPFFLDSRDVNVRPFVSDPRAPEALFILSHLFFSFCCLDWRIPFDRLQVH